MPRIKRIQSPTNIYHVMARGNNKNKIFLDEEDKYKYLKIISRKKEKFSFLLYSYALMDNHIHLVINENESTISEIMKSINVSYVMYFNKKYDRVGHLFQGRFKSEVVDSDQYLLSLIRYVHNNPVKANIVKDLNDYLWTSYKYYAEKNKEDYLVDSNRILSMISDNKVNAIKAFIKFSKENNEDIYLDIENAKQIKNKDEAIKYIKERLKEENIAENYLINKPNNIKGTIIHNLIVEIKEKSNLSLREIGEMFKISKSTIQRLT